MCLLILGKPGGKPSGKQPFKPSNSERGQSLRKPRVVGGPQKFNKKKPGCKFTRKRKEPDGNNKHEGRKCLFIIQIFYLEHSQRNGHILVLTI